MEFEWDEDKSQSNKMKQGIDFDTAKYLWNDNNRIEIEAPYPLEHRSILIAKIDKKLCTAIFTKRGNATRLISVRRARKQEVNLYGEKENG
ncbi:MAG: BrnT family toxin [Thermodesulfobacteriota bacterium]|nr:BrnT family toxin [Thermodesulfobacteriota bacterium]